MFLQMWSVLQEPEFEQFLRPEVPAARAEGFVVPYGDCPLDGERVPNSPNCIFRVVHRWLPINVCGNGYALRAG